MLAVGLMSGTSLDGIDAALVEIKGSGINTKVDLLEFETFKIPSEIKNEIKKACLEDKSSVDLICSLNFKLGNLFADAVIDILNRANIDIEQLDYIASHGQTIYHIPKDREGLVKSTLQIGEASVIAYKTNTLVISNFRVMDMAANGEGAPLVPYTEYILYSEKEKGIALQNIGGIGNVTVLPESNLIDDIFAFDTGPGNMAIDEACNILFGIPYDKDGKIASSGVVNDEMLNELMKMKYIHEKPPKTTGREDFGQRFVEKVIDKYSELKSEDIIATLTMFTAKSISYNYKKFIIPNNKLEKVIIAGGGAHNKTLIKFIKEELEGIEVLIQEDLGFSSDAKEAIAFAVLGNETLNNNFSNVPSATGANEKVILGQITMSPRIFNKGDGKYGFKMCK
ncbi:anhydro-N-acetylmuramic acid kinase AnmK [Clostridium sp. Ade.TY]|uniref:anhydro-N-acetylmuramic acid kinase AnmK n=1 Tax=Clostridium sp. Ade.TY TaxID=1391647 RepID=UPI000420D6C0|nr:anhydro-N-acetylmuramic acid kinase AnmK [Clostridium sp. Ade.TY]